MFKIPKNQKSWTTYYSAKGVPKFIMTSDTFRVTFMLYSIEGTKLVKVATGANPLKIEEEYHIREVLLKC